MQHVVFVVIVSMSWCWSVAFASAWWNTSTATHGFCHSGSI